MSRVLVVTAPAAVVSLTLAKQHLRVDSADQDALIEAYVAAATSHIDGPGGWLGRAIGQQALEIRLDDFTGDVAGAIALPFQPVQSLTSVKYLDTNGTEQTVAGATYFLADERELHLAHDATWPSPRTIAEAVRIRYVAGYATVPPPIVAAILLMTADLFENRGTAVVGTIAAAIPMSTTVERLLSPFRAWDL